MELEAILEQYVGFLGPYQLYVLLLVFFTRLPAAIHNIGYVFYAATPDHWCRFPRRDDIINLTEPQWKRFAIPLKDKAKVQYEQCSMYSWAVMPNLTAEDINNTLTAITEGLPIPQNTTMSCDSWEYDTWTHVSSSLVSEWNMVCGRAWMKANIASVYVVGWVVGAQLGGYFSDRFGRRPTLIGASALAVVFGIALPFCQHYVAFLVMRCLLSATSNAINTYPLTLELVGTRYRTVLTAIYQCWWALSYMLVPAVAFGVRSWFTFMLVLAAPTVVILMVPACLLPESLQWLVAKGRQEKAEATLQKMARWNRRVLPPDIKLSFQKDEEKQETRVLDLFRTLNICRITFILCFSWFLNGMVYYLISWNSDALQGNIYLNTFLSGLVEIPAYLVNIPALQLLGRRWGNSVCLLACGALCLISAFVSGTASTVMILGAKFFISMTFTMIWQYTAELYPTVARATALGLTNLFARLGTFISSYIPLAGPYASAGICGGFCLAGALAIFLLPETMYSTLPVDFEEVEERAKLKARDMVACPCSYRVEPSSQKVGSKEAEADVTAL